MGSTQPNDEPGFSLNPIELLKSKMQTAPSPIWERINWSWFSPKRLAIGLSSVAAVVTVGLGLNYMRRGPENPLEEGTYFEYRIDRSNRFGNKTYEFRHDHELDSITFFKEGKLVVHAEHRYNPDEERFELQISNGVEEDPKTPEQERVMYRPNELQVLKFEGTWPTDEPESEPVKELGILSNVYDAIKSRIPFIEKTEEGKKVEETIKEIEKEPVEQEDPNVKPPYCYAPIKTLGFTRLVHCTYGGDWQGYGFRVETEKALERLADEAFVVCTKSGKQVIYKVPLTNELSDRMKR